MSVRKVDACGILEEFLKEKFKSEVKRHEGKAVKWPHDAIFWSKG